MNRTLMECTRAMKQAAKLPEEFWAEAFTTATYLTNRSPSGVLPRGKTPYEMWWGQNPSIAHVRISGCLTYAYIPNKFNRMLQLSRRMKMNNFMEIWKMRKKCLIRLIHQYFKMLNNIVIHPEKIDVCHQQDMDTS